MNSTNPLRQYFRRPAVYIKLPSNGIGYRPGSLAQTETGEYPVYPMTAIDEITLNTPDALFNGEAVAQMIRSCVPGILDPWSLSGNDLDSVLIAIKIASNGSKMEVQTKCPGCEETTKFDANLTGILNSIQPGDYSVELKLDDLFFKFRPLTYKEINAVGNNQFEFQKKFDEMMKTDDLNQKAALTREALVSITDLTVQMISTMIEYVKTPDSIVTDKQSIYEYLRNCDKNTYDKIRDYSTKLKESSEIKPFSIKCMHCSHEYEQPFSLNPTVFFEQGS